MELDLSHVPRLEELACGFNRLLKELDLTRVPNLKILHCEGNSLSELHVPTSTLQQLTEFRHDPDVRIRT